jgi:hypothetical protein
MTEDDRKMAEIMAAIRQAITGEQPMWLSPLGTPYLPLDQQPAPPGTRLNEAPPLGKLIRGQG